MSQPLLQAAEANLYDDVVELISEGADVNYQNPDPQSTGYTALIEATLNLNAPLMRYLLEHGALVDKEDHSGMRAINHLYTEYVGGNEADLLPALRLLHEFRADLQYSNQREDTLLQWAAFNGYMGIVTFLLEAGLDPNDAIEDAREGQDEDMIAFLENAIQKLEIGTELDDEVKGMSLSKN